MNFTSIHFNQYLNFGTRAKYCKNFISDVASIWDICLEVFNLRLNVKANIKANTPKMMKNHDHDDAFVSTFFNVL